MNMNLFTKKKIEFEEQEPIKKIQSRKDKEMSQTIYGIFQNDLKVHCENTQKKLLKVFILRI